MTAREPATTYVLPVPSGRVMTDWNGAQFVVEDVEWTTYALHNGTTRQTITIHGVEADGEPTNVTLNGRDVVPSWVPTPPAAWFQLAAKIRAEAAGLRVVSS